MDDPLVRITGGSPSYYHGDGLSSVVGMSNSSGALVATNRYGAWGNVVESTGVTPQYGYTGREPDATGLVYYRARYYDPQIGRFTQPDPKGFIDGLNQYTYVMNSPVNYVDPWGMTANSHTSTWNSGGYISYVGQTISNSASLVGNAIYNGIVQPINTAINFMGSDDMVGLAQSIPSPMEVDNAVVGVFAGISKLTSATKSTKYAVGEYNALRNAAETGLDAHHVGQKAVMREFISNYNPKTAPSILVPKVGHTIKGPRGIVSRTTAGFTNARQVVARDIKELRRVYPDLPNSQLKILIEMNKTKYPTLNNK